MDNFLICFEHWDNFIQTIGHLQWQFWDPGMYSSAVVCLLSSFIILFCWSHTHTHTHIYIYIYMHIEICVWWWSTMLCNFCGICFDGGRYVPSQDGGKHEHRTRLSYWSHRNWRMLLLVSYFRSNFKCRRWHIAENI